MKKIIITRGAPGSGKSTLVDQLGLRPYALSMDMIRPIFSSLEMNQYGNMGLSQEKNRFIYQKFSEILQERMGRGEFLIIDQTTPAKADVDYFKNLAKEYNYELLMVDFSSLSLETLKKQNLQRPSYNQVPEEAIQRIHDLLHATRLDVNDMTVIPVNFENLDETYKKIKSWMKTPIYDLSDYEEIVHIGDIQGCYTVLTDKDGPFSEELDPDKAYIFVGDLLDRGIENGKVMRWFHDTMLNNPNVFLIWGNHEDHLWRWGSGKEAVSMEFKEKTLPQLIEADVTPEMALAVCQRAQYVLPYYWRGQKVMVCHAGITSIPEDFTLISTDQYSRGVGEWTADVDKYFEQNAPEGWVQVHGHRNGHGRNIIANKNSINLEDRVEYGGALRIATLSQKGWTPFSYNNHVYLEMRQRNLRIQDNTPLSHIPPYWMKEEQNIKLDETTYEKMQTHNFIKIKKASKKMPHIKSIAFTKAAFFDQEWDDLSIKARGLFVNQHTMEIVARSYEKFFNIDEKPETSISKLGENMVFPVTAYRKENGFLGNVGYDSETKKIFVASKSSADGEFSERFQEMFKELIPIQKREEIKRWLRDNEASMVFEVIDPVFDPHMVDYEQPKLVLLDVFHRSEKSEKLPYEHMKAVGEYFGLNVKEVCMTFKTPIALEKFYDSTSVNLNWKYKGDGIEGFVLEDQVGFQTKFKTPYYAFWKKMRNQLFYIQKNKKELEPYLTIEEAKNEAVLLREQANKLREKRDNWTKENIELIGTDEDQKQIQQIIRLAGKSDSIFKKIKAFSNDIRQGKHPLAEMFLSWAEKTYTFEELENTNILKMRARFMDEVKPSEEILKTPWNEFKEILAEEFDRPEPVLEKKSKLKFKP